MNAIVTAFSQTKCNKKVMAMRIIAKRAGTSPEAAFRDAQVAETFGIGSIIIGRRGYETRFKTNVSNDTFKRLHQEASGKDENDE